MSAILQQPSPMILLGVGGAGCVAVGGVSRAYGPGMRVLAIDTDARSAEAGCPFMLLGGSRLNGNGAGGSVPDAQNAVHDDLRLLEDRLTGIRTAVVVTGLGGGTGGGGAIEIVNWLRANGIATMLLATTPFAFEGDACLKRARTARSILESAADVSVMLPLDKLTAGLEDAPHKDAFRRATDTLAAGATLLWRLIEKPGYLALDPERLHRILLDGGPARFATVSETGPDRAERAVEALKVSPLLKDPSAPRTRAMLVGVLAGDDLRLSEIGHVANELSFTFGPDAELSLGTVNDEEHFSGRLTVVALLFGEGRRNGRSNKADQLHRTRGGITGPRGKGRFDNAEPSQWCGEDLDTPTYMRRGITLDR